MQFLVDEPITSYFSRISENGSAASKRKRSRQETKANPAVPSTSKKPKVQQKLDFSHVAHDKRISKRCLPDDVVVLEAPMASSSTSRTRGKTSKTRSISVDELSRASLTETPATSRINPLPTPLTAQRSVSTHFSRPFLTPPHWTDNSTTTPGPVSLCGSQPRKSKILHLPTPDTMPRYATTINYRSRKSPPIPEQTMSPRRKSQSPSPDVSQSPSFYPQSSEYEESMPTKEGQPEESYFRYASSEPPASQCLIPSSQSQCDGDSPSINFSNSEVEHSMFLDPPFSNKAFDIDLETVSSQNLLSASPSSGVPGNSIQINDGQEYVLSSQSQLMLPLYISPRKSRRKISTSSNTSIHKDTTPCDETIPSSQSQLEKELDISLELAKNRRCDESQPIGVSIFEEDAVSFLSPEAKTQVLVEETPEGFYDPPFAIVEDDDPGSVTEEESEHEDDDGFSQDELRHGLDHPGETAPSISQLSIPSSLPDAIKEFHGMFGIGDASYPESFPMSLR
ncbi:hypothetical protein H0H93_006509 [Arthromyces matolae]|nr:hypothetical protein H0H93_006509 [Arthromyces matolae]